MSVSDLPIGRLAPAGAPPHISAGIRRLALFYVWLTIATVGIVVADPAPYDALIMGATLMIPVVGLMRVSTGLAVYFFVWMVICAGGYIATTQAGTLEFSLPHTNITLFLALTSVPLVGFVGADSNARVHLLLSAYTVSAVIAVVAALIGYFNLLPGAYDIFTQYGRAQGTFEDPNVFGAFLVPAILYCFYLVLNSSLTRAALVSAVGGFLLFGCLLSLSRGAWASLFVALLTFSFCMFSTAPTNRQRVKLFLVLLMAAIVAIGVVAAVQMAPNYAELFGERTSFEQSYDIGPEGRFAGHVRAMGLIVENPLGLGALEYARIWRLGDVHEVYLSMFLNTGWIGGLLYLGLVIATLALAIRRVIYDRGGDGLSAVALGAFVALVLEGFVIDTDHWRHFFVIMALIWGMALDMPPKRRGASDDRPV
ncbi:O-antigen ligase family protein [Methyloligella solikamskensis]|uniref:O-antigen ligase family protein n=1 Tax=Methyloligella solikamskensis TaxID=1177756 RepID=A0ABW3JA35_9HYPH